MLSWIEQRMIQAKLLQRLPQAGDELQAKLNVQVCLYFGLTVLAVTAFRPLIASLPPIFFFLGLLNSGLLFTLWWQLRKGKWQQHAAVLIVTITLLILLPMYLMSGGANSHYSPLIPLFPIFSILLGNVGLAVVTTLFWTALSIVLVFFGFNDFDVTATPWEQGKLVSKTMWIVLTSLLLLVTAISFENRQRRLQHELLALSTIDPLTGVGNRRILDASLSEQYQIHQRVQQPYCIMMIDVDHFKRYNDIHGHQLGDEALKKVAQTLLSLAREGQDTVARYGGEEFVVILRQTNAKQAMKVAGKYRQAVLALNLPYYKQEQEQNVLSVTIGLADSELASHPEALLKLADQALYKGKQQGRNCVVCATEISE